MQIWRFEISMIHRKQTSLRANYSQPEIYDKIRLYNLKRTLLHLAGTKNSSWTDRSLKSGRFEINRFQD